MLPGSPLLWIVERSQLSRIVLRFSQETQRRLTSAFEADWQRSRLKQLRIVKNKDELAMVRGAGIRTWDWAQHSTHLWRVYQVKSTLRRHYTTILHVFSWYSCVSSNLLGMSLTSYTQFCQTCEIQDEVGCTTTVGQRSGVSALSRVD